VTYFTTVFSMCSTCHSIIGKLFCTKKHYLLYNRSNILIMSLVGIRLVLDHSCWIKYSDIR
jgi:hypothetical protein